MYSKIAFNFGINLCYFVLLVFMDGKTTLRKQFKNLSLFVTKCNVEDFQIFFHLRIFTQLR